MRKSIPILVPTTSLIKPVQTVVLLLAISLGGCKKDNTDPVRNTIRDEFTIVETNSNRPVQGAMVIAAGNFTATDSAITNDSGKVVFNTAEGINHLWIHKDKYWPGEFSYFFGWPTLSLSPIGTLKVHITKSAQSQVPPNSLLNLRPIAWACESCVAQLTQLDLPRDRIIYLKGGGNSLNSVDWQIDSGQVQANHQAPWSSTQDIMINRFDTAEFEIKY